MISRKYAVSKSEVEFLVKSIGSGKTIVEIGCYIGKTTSALADAGNKVIAIDPFTSGYNSRDPLSTDMSGVEDEFRKIIKGRNIIWCKEKSENVLKRWKTLVDGVFIDGNHIESFVLKDLGWIKFIKEGGILAFHDYRNWPSVTRVVDLHVVPKYQKIGMIGSLVVFRKEKK